MILKGVKRQTGTEEILVTSSKSMVNSDIDRYLSSVF